MGQAALPTGRCRRSSWSQRQGPRRGDHRGEDGGLQRRGQPRDRQAGRRPSDRQEHPDYDAGARWRRPSDAVHPRPDRGEATAGNARGAGVWPRRGAGDRQDPDRDRQGLHPRPLTFGRGRAGGQHVGDVRADRHRPHPGPTAFKPVQWHWDFGDGRDATTKVRTVEHSYEDRPQRTGVSSFLSMSVLPTRKESSCSAATLSTSSGREMSSSSTPSSALAFQ